MRKRKSNIRAWIRGYIYTHVHDECMYMDIQHDQLPWKHSPVAHVVNQRDLQAKEEVSLERWMPRSLHPPYQEHHHRHGNKRTNIGRCGLGILLL